MSISSQKGNNPELWNKLLEVLDEKLQLGLLGKLKNITAYHLEDGILTIEPGDQKDEDYLKKDAVFQQLQILAQDAIKVEKIKIKPFRTSQP